MIHLISYDIEDDRERLQVSKVLEGFGRRVQKSVFECPLNFAIA
jgi:CRISPR-associated protein Cas2